MNLETAVATMRAYFDAQWGGLTPVAYDDVEFDIPNGETWVRLSIKHSHGYQASMGSPGSNRFRSVGALFIQVFAPEGNASKDARQKADAALEIFRGLTYQDINFYDVYAKEIGNADGWYQINVIANFRYDHIT